MMQHCVLCEREVVLPTTWFRLVMCPPASVCCEECQISFERVSGETCRMCHRPFADIAPQYRQGDMCYDCIRWEEDAKWRGTLYENRSAYVYNEKMKDVLATCKFRGDVVLFHAFEYIFQHVYKEYFADVNIVVPIPLSPERLYERGFNQAAILASFLQTPVEDLLCRIHTEKQSKKSRTERIYVENVFRYNKPNRLEGQTVLLVDDIYTTGSTLRHAANILLQHGAKKICALTLVRG
jgi:competence protein ComFC